MKDTVYKLSGECLERMVAYAREYQPVRACGLVAAKGMEIVKVFPCANAAKRNDKEFQLLPTEMVNRNREIEEGGGRLVGIYYSDPNGPPHPQSDIIQSWAFPWLLCFVVSLQNGHSSPVEAYRIVNGAVERILLEFGSHSPEAAQRDSRSIGAKDNAGYHPIQAVILPDQMALVQEIRSRFAVNMFLGWRVFLEKFDAALTKRQHAFCLGLVKELEAEGYEPSLSQLDFLTELHDLVQYKEGGFQTLWAFYAERADLEKSYGSRTGEAAMQFRLGLVFEQLRQFGAAHSCYEESQKLWEASAAFVRSEMARDALVALRHHEDKDKPHPFFEKLWTRILAGRIDVDYEFKQMIQEAIRSGDWRKGRAAVGALDELGAKSDLADALENAEGAVQIAAMAALCKRRAQDVGDHLLLALRNESPVIRERAIVKLREGGVDAVDALAQIFEHDVDASVRILAADVLGSIGTPRVIPNLQRASNILDIGGNRLVDTATKAVETIQQRYSAPVLPSHPPLPVRTEAQRAAYVIFDTIMVALSVTGGAYIMAKANAWVAVGYVLYALVAKTLLESLNAPYDFYQDKPCYTGWRRRLMKSRNHSRNGIQVYFFYFPLGLLPVVVGLTLLLGSFSWKSLAAMLSIALAVAFLSLMRSGLKVHAACAFCAARKRCPRWNGYLGGFQSSPG